MKVGDKVYSLIVGSDNKYHIIAGIIKKMVPTYSESKEFKRYELSIKWNSGKYTSIPDIRVYPSRGLAMDALRRSNELY